jgi:hypothetical protein
MTKFKSRIAVSARCSSFQHLFRHLSLDICFVLGVCRIAREPAKLVDQVRFLAGTFRQFREGRRAMDHERFDDEPLFHADEQATAGIPVRGER